MTNKFRLIIIRIFFRLLFISSLFYVINSDISVTARCGKPVIPPKAHLRQISPERSRFDNKERVFVICEENQFPHHLQERRCKNGHWTGKKARCGKSLDAQVINFEINDCESPINYRLLSQPINQTAESEYALPPNSFHSSRIGEELISANGSNCYLWKLKFDKKVQISFLLIDIYSPSFNMSKEIPNLVPIVSKYRTCKLQKTNQQYVDGTEVIGYYFFCDYKSEEDRIKDMNDLKDTISIHINTSVAKEIGLEAVFIGDIYTTTYGTNKSVKPDCGDLEIENAGVMVQKELGYMNIRCNESFRDYWVNPEKRLFYSGNVKYKFTCDLNGQWVGEWPVCIPIITCPKEEIIEDKDPTVDIEEISNTYYLNESQWFAINDTIVKYMCHNEDDIMVGKSVRMCLKNGKWSNKPPYCTGTSISGFAISGILFAVLIIFILIVLIVFRFHSNRVKRELTQTRHEIEETTRKRISEEFYADVRDSNLYEDTNGCGRKSVMYEAVDYEIISDEPPRYQIGNNRVHSASPEYLDMLAVSEVMKS